ncbi:MAG: manganese efflux pump [Acutalibacteraceae bacterium]|nr:manganese efflux pump [Acutalibacteraceae bacterium]
MLSVLIINSMALGAGLAMDAFSVSMANGLHEPFMKKRKAVTIAGVFAFFQAAMPMLGWICVQTICNVFESFEKFIPYIALVLLCFIGGKMLIDGIKNKDSEENCNSGATFGGLIVQGIATSIDALSAGFTMDDSVGSNVYLALLCALIIAVVTFIICVIGVYIGKRFGTALSGKAGIFGGIILIAIGIEIFITGII